MYIYIYVKVGGNNSTSHAPTTSDAFAGGPAFVFFPLHYIDFAPSNSKTNLTLRKTLSLPPLLARAPSFLFHSITPPHASHTSVRDRATARDYYTFATRFKPHLRVRMPSPVRRVRVRARKS